MHRGFVHLTNAALLVIVLVGVPVVTSIQWGKIRLTSSPEFQLLTMGGLTAGVALNVCGIMFGGGKPRNAYSIWTFVFGTLLGVHWALLYGYVHFEWLKEWLSWAGGR